MKKYESSVKRFFSRKVLRFCCSSPAVMSVIVEIGQSIKTYQRKSSKKVDSNAPPFPNLARDAKTKCCRAKSKIGLVDGVDTDWAGFFASG